MFKVPRKYNFIVQQHHNQYTETNTVFDTALDFAMSDPTHHPTWEDKTVIKLESETIG